MRNNPILRKIWHPVTALAVILAVLLGVISTGHPAEARGGTCDRRTVSVHLTEADDAPAYRIVGWLCGPRVHRTSDVELLLHGLTYDHAYWSFPGYSYVAFATATGRTTFSVDRLGVGESDKPPADEVTLPAQAYVAGQLVAALRNGVVTGSPVRHVIGVGHSGGAGIWMDLFGTTDVATQRSRRPDALVIEDFMHDVNLPRVIALTAARYPAQDDPRFARAGLPTGYQTTRPGTRDLFYDTRFADRWVVTHDEATKATVTSGEANTLGVVRDPALSRAIDVPTFVMLGAHDALYCNAVLSCATAADLRKREAPNYTSAPNVRWMIMPLAGHDTNLHRDAYLGFAAVWHWLALQHWLVR